MPDLVYLAGCVAFLVAMMAAVLLCGRPMRGGMVEVPADRGIPVGHRGHSA